MEQRDLRREGGRKWRVRELPQLSQVRVDGGLARLGEGWWLWG